MSQEAQTTNNRENLALDVTITTKMVNVIDVLNTTIRRLFATMLSLWIDERPGAWRLTLGTTGANRRIITTHAAVARATIRVISTCPRTDALLEITYGIVRS